MRTIYEMMEELIDMLNELSDLGRLGIKDERTVLSIATDYQIWKELNQI